MPLGCAAKPFGAGESQSSTAIAVVRTTPKWTDRARAESLLAWMLFFVAILRSCGLEFEIGTTYPSNNPLDFWGTIGGGCKKTT